MNDPASRQVSRTGDDGFARRAAAGSRADLIQCMQDRRAAGVVDGTIHASPAGQSGIGGVDDRIRRYPRAVALDQSKFRVSNVEVHDEFATLTRLHRGVARLAALLQLIACSSRLMPPPLAVE